MALFGKKKPKAAKTPDPAEDEEPDEKAVAEVVDESSVELKAEALAPKRRGGGIIGSIASLLVITLIAAGGGTGLGLQTAASLQAALAARDAVPPPSGPSPLTGKFTNDTLVKALDAVITNLASPMDTWVRLETSIVFKAGALASPDVTAAEIRQDEVAYLRTIDISQLEGPSALQHLRDDLNERASLRSSGKVSELIIQSLIVQ